MLLNLVLVALGGMLGSVLRYLVSLYAPQPTAFPLRTFIVNAAGSLLIGVFFGLAEKSSWFSAHWRLLFITGFCGGFTTFSTFSLENMLLLQNGEYGMVLLYIAASVIICIGAVLLGARLATLGLGY